MTPPLPARKEASLSCRAVCCPVTSDLSVIRRGADGKLKGSDLRKSNRTKETERQKGPPPRVNLKIEPRASYRHHGRCSADAQWSGGAAGVPGVRCRERYCAGSSSTGEGIPALLFFLLGLPAPLCTPQHPSMFHGVKRQKSIKRPSTDVLKPLFNSFDQNCHFCCF